MNWLRRLLRHRPAPAPRTHSPARTMRPCEHRVWLDVEMGGWLAREQCAACGGWRFKDDTQ